MDKYLIHEIEELNRLKDKLVLISICEVDGTLLAISDYNAKLMRIDDPRKLIGLNGEKLTSEQIKWLMPEVTDNEITLVQTSYKTLNHLYKIIAQEQYPISYINFMPYGGIRKPYLETAVPIFGEKLQVVGIKIIATEYSLYGQNEYFQELSHQRTLTTNKKEPDAIHRQLTQVKLADRQLEIVYLLANGFAQSDVAQILNISRGAIANIVSEQICPKFNIAGSSTKLLVAKAIALGLNKTMPPGLYKPFIIILNAGIVERWFQ